MLLLCRALSHTSHRRSPGFAVWWQLKWPFKCRGVGPGRSAGRRPPDAARRSLALAVAAGALVLVSARWVVAVAVAVTVAVAVAVSVSLVRARGVAGLVTSRARDRASCAPCSRHSGPGSGSAVL